ncbi:MAG: site-specific integrase [Verrucomicrobiota bacterium]
MNLHSDPSKALAFFNERGERLGNPSRMLGQNHPSFDRRGEVAQRENSGPAAGETRFPGCVDGEGHWLMYQCVFKRKGSRVYRGKYRLSNGPKIFNIPLGVPQKHLAQAKLKQIVDEKEAQLLGIGIPKPLRESAALSVSVLVEEYREEIAARGRGKKHATAAVNAILRVCKDCTWMRLGDMTSDGFNRWRTRQTMAPKTSNEYLAYLSAFFVWLDRNQRWQGKPFKNVVKAQTRGRETVMRRALTDDELRQLITTSGPRGLVYLVAAYTGLRRNEMKLLDWCDVDLRAELPCLRVRASTTKSKRGATLPLLPPLATALRDLKAKKGGNPVGRVFHYRIPRMPTLRRDLDRLGIPYVDSIGRRFDFHAFRKTFCTILHRMGVPMRVAQELMRHSDARLTMEVYTDANALPLFQEMAKITAPSCSPIGSPQSGILGVRVSSPDQDHGLRQVMEWAGESELAPACPKENWRREPESNRR